MKQYLGIWMPEWETHLPMIMDSPKSPVIDGRGSYQFLKFKRALRCLNGTRRAIDIGANVGMWSINMCSRFKRVEAFEPVEEYRECFKKNLEGVDNFRLWPEACGAYAHEARMIVEVPGHCGNTYIDPDEEEYEDVPLVPVIPLDSHGFKFVDLIKIDCEGYELHVVQGAKKTIVENRPVVIVEQKAGWPERHGLPPLGAVTFLEDLGMILMKNYSEDYIMGWK